MKCIKRIIPILIVIVICISVIPFAVSAQLSQYSYYYSYGADALLNNYSDTIYSISPISFNWYYDSNGNNPRTFSGEFNKVKLIKATLNYILRFSRDSDNITFDFAFALNNGYLMACAPSTAGIALFAQLHYDNPDILNYYGFAGSNTSTYYTEQCYINRDFTTSEIGFNAIKFSNSPISQNYTLTFNSNGGTSIAPITDIEPNSTINLVGQYGEYLPQFVPEKEFYDFSGWSLTDNGTNVSSVTVTQDTTLYANWVADARNTMIIYDSANGWMNFYGDQNHTTSPPTLVISGNNVSINVYYEVTSQVPNGYYLSYFNIEENGTTYRIIPDALYINVIVDTPGYIQITPVFTQLKTLTVSYNPTGDLQDNTMEFGVLEPAYKAGTSVVLTGYYSYPMFVTNIRLVGNNSQKIYYIDFNDSWDEQENAFYFEIMFTMPDENSHITIYWSVMGGVAPLPVVSYDESGNAYFMGVSEENLFSQDFSGARDLIPEEFVGIVEYFGALQGLSIVVTIILVAGFAAFLLRRA